jgi:hypothetical protein
MRQELVEKLEVQRQILLQAPVISWLKPAGFNW